MIVCDAGKTGQAKGFQSFQLSTFERNVVRMVLRIERLIQSS